MPASTGTGLLLLPDIIISLLALRVEIVVLSNRVRLGILIVSSSRRIFLIRLKKEVVGEVKRFSIVFIIGP